jgi:hypothetical protein
MAIEKIILDKYSKKENQILSIKNNIIISIKEHTGILIDPQKIDVKEKTATLQISSVIKSVVFEKKIEIEKDLKDKNEVIYHIQ